MPPATDYIRHAARLARQLVLDAGPGGSPAPDAEYYKVLARHWNRSPTTRAGH